MDFTYLPTKDTYQKPSQNAAFASDVNFIKCPGFEDQDDCYYAATQRVTINPGSSWKCRAGYFCFGPTAAETRCGPGFYCPTNTSQPMFCPRRYHCTADAKKIDLCPEGHFCPIGTIEPRKCWLGSCPRGTGSAPQQYTFFIFFGFFLLVLFFFNRKNYIDRMKALKHRHQIYERLIETEYAHTAEKSHNDDPSGAESKEYQVERKFEISFKDIGLTLPGGLEIMKGVSGRFRPGRTVAIMGPSGSGKSTLLSLITGKASKTTGSIIIDGKEEDLSKYRKLVGFVPQEDVMLRELTVRDVLMHSARMRLPKSWSYDKIKKMVNDTITFLGLSQVTDTVIGDAEERGISGGQRKRVNIGMEMVSNPSVLFLDEPTSGLDSTTSRDICRILRSVAKKKGISVIAVIHSPSVLAFNMFDDILLLGKGGRTIYFGARDRASSYFGKIGFPCPKDCPLADHIMDVVTGKMQSQATDNFKVADLADYWSNVQQGLPPLRTYHSLRHGDGMPGFKAINSIVDEDQLSRQVLLDEAEAFYQGQADVKRSIQLRGSTIDPLNMLVKIHSNRSSTIIKTPPNTDRSSFMPPSYNKKQDTLALLKQASSNLKVSKSTPILPNESFLNPEFIDEERIIPGTPDTRDDASTTSGSSQVNQTWSSIKTTCISIGGSIAWWVNDVLQEFRESFISSCCCLDSNSKPIRQTPGLLKAFSLLFKRACLQIYKTPTGFMVDLSIHLASGMLIAVAIQNFDYWGRQPREICANSPINLQPFCMRPHDDMQFAGIFICFGVLFAGISAGGNTFGSERIVFWRETSNGMSTLAYYVAKVLADIPRIVLACALFTLGFSVFYPYRSSIFEIGLIFLLLYLNSYAMGYFLSAVVRKERVALAGCGISLLFGLLLSGVLTTKGIENLLMISPARWAIESFWLTEVPKRAFKDDLAETIPKGYSLNGLGRTYIAMLILFTGWHILAFTFLKLSHRKQKK